jgi:hypothetical protein
MALKIRRPKGLECSVIFARMFMYGRNLVEKDTIIRIHQASMLHKAQNLPMEGWHSQDDHHRCLLR